MEETDTVLITGAASGIGRATARRLASRMPVVIADVNADAAAALAAELTRSGSRAHAVAVDVANRASVARMMAWIDAESGPVHALFNNAGINRRAALELAPHGIRVNALGPGPIDTPLLRSGRTPAQWEAVRDGFHQRLPMGRLGRPEEIAAVADFLLSERSAYITGQIIHPNGGQLSW